MRVVAVIAAAVVASACTSPGSAGPGLVPGTDAGVDAAAPADAMIDAAPDARPPTSRFSFMPATLDFGYVPVGGFSNEKNLLVNNNGIANITEFALSVSGSDAAAVTIDVDPSNEKCTSTLTPLGCIADVILQVTEPGELDAQIIAMGSDQIPASVAVHAIGGSPLQASWDQPVLDFGTVAVGSEAGQLVTYTNTGTVTLPPVSFDLTGEVPDQFRLEDDLCSGVALAGGASCSVVIAYAPTSVERGGTATLFGSAGNVTEIDLRGAPAATTSIEVSPGSASFGTVQAPNAPTLPFIVTNTGSADASDLTARTGGQFSVASASSCAGPLAPGASCEVDVRFAPTGTGPTGSNLTLFFANSTSAQASFTGVAEPAQGVVLDSYAHDFGSAEVGQVGSAFTFTVTNVGTAATSVTLGFDDAGNDYEIVADTCSNTSIAAQTSCSIELAFAPKATGGTFARLHVTTPTNAAIAALTGEAQPIPPSGMSVTPNRYDFGSYTIGMTANAPLTVFNNGTTPLTPTITLAGSDAGELVLADDPCTGVAVPGKTECDIDVRFVPATTGAKTASVVVTWDVGSNGFTTVPLTGSATQATGSFVTPDPSFFDFGAVPVGELVTTPVTFENHGLTTSQPLQLTMEGPDNADFWVIDDGCTDAVLVHGETCTDTVAFDPTATGSRANELTVTSLGDGGSHVTLRGSGQ